MKIFKFEELNGIKKENNELLYEDGKIVVYNKKDGIKIEIDAKNRVKALNKLNDLLELKIELWRLEEKEILEYIQGKNFEKTLWSPIGKAMHEYNMLENGDKVAVGISGGKDSLTVLNALVRIKKIANIDFEIIPIHIHPVEKGEKYKEIEAYCEKLGTKLEVIKTSISDEIQNNKNVKNPCFLCSRIRRGILYRIMKERGINKLVLGHHKDDLIETFLLNVFYQGNLGVMKPAYESREYGVKVIRPLAYVEEKDIIRYSKKLGLPILKNECLYETSENSKRLKIKKLIEKFSKEDSDIRSIVLKSIKNLFK